MKRSDKTYKAFDQEYLTELCDSFNIVEFINEYIPLTKAGQNHKASCPFHADKTPSFVVSPTKGMYHCFSCKKGGNVIRFLMDREGMTFFEAVIFLSEKAGKTPPHATNTEEYQKFKKTQEALLKANEVAVELWAKNLSVSKEAKDYLKERGITKDTIDLFKIGFTTENWSQLTDALIKDSKIELEMATQGGLVSISKTDLPYDRFRNRVMTPISDVNGKVIGFSGRTLSTDKREAKYVNSPDTPIYNKGKHLFGLNITKDAIRVKGFAILTEGNFDIISLYQNGVENAVAGLGTALTTHQAKLLKRFTDKVVICYDADDAGVLAAERAIKVLQAEGFLIKVMELPTGDPDDFIRKEGKTTFNQLRGQAVSWFKYLLNKSIKEHDVTNPTDKVKILKRVQELVAFATTELEKREYFNQAMDVLKIDKDIARKSWSEISSDPAPVDDPEKPTATLTESKLLQLLLYADDRKTPIEEVKKYLQTPEVRKIALILATLKGEFRYTLVESLLDDPDKAFLRQVSLDADEHIPQLADIEDEIKHCITAIKRDALQAELEKVADLITDHLKVDSADWEKEANDLFAKQLNTAKELRALM